MPCRRSMPRSLRNCRPMRRAMGWTFVRRRMATELGPDWQAKFGKFDKEASFAASLGQVHRATLLDGTEVAAKLQYPDMASALEADLNQLKLVFAVGQRFDPAIRTDEIHAEITTRLREELDYRREAKHVAALPPPAARRAQRARARGRGLAFDRPAAHHDLAAGRASPELEEPLAGGEGPARHPHVPRLVRAVLCPTA